MALRTGILGLGKMGRHHLRCAALADGVELVAAGDVDPGRAEIVPDGVAFETDPEALIAACDAIVLAVPTDRHRELGCRILGAGRHLLVEKPLAATGDDCRALGAAAAEGGAVLGVGHVERWNGALTGLGDAWHKPRFVEGHRLAGFDPRGTEVDVVLDLMIHDLDLILDLYGVEPDRVEAVGVAVISDRVDIANARLEFPGGELVNLTASRVSREPVRKLRLFQEEAYVSIDLGAQKAEVFERRDGAPGGFVRSVVQAAEGHNPLVRELEDFARACRGEPSRVPDLVAGTRAVVLAERILESIAHRNERWAATPSGGPAWAADAPS